MNRGARAFVDNEAIRMLKYYLNHEKIGMDPFVEGAMGGPFLQTSKDAMVSTRCLILANCAIAIHQRVLRGLSRDHDSRSVLLEAATYLFQNPFINTTKLKKMLGPFKHNAFAISTKGSKLVWKSFGEEILNFTEEEIPHWDRDWETRYV